MKTTTKKIVAWKLLLLMSGTILVPFAFADSSRSDPTSSRLIADSGKGKGNDKDDDNRGNMGNNRGNGNVKSAFSNNDGGKSSRRFLRQEDANYLDNRINGIPSFRRVEALLRVLVRIDLLETSIENNTAMTAERKARLLALLEEVRTFIQDRLDAAIGTGTGSVDTAAPVISSLVASHITSTGAKLSVVSNESGTGYFVAVVSGSAVPSAMQVKLGQNASSSSAVSSGSAIIAAGTTELSVVNLAPNTAYTAYFVATDINGNVTSVPVSVSFMTSMTPDTMAPTINSLSLSGTTSTGTTLLANMSEDGKWFFVALPSGSSIPSSVQIKAGQNALGAAASIKGSGATLSGITAFPVTGLSPNTSSIIFFTAEDTSGNLQPIPQALSLSTPQ